MLAARFRSFGCVLLLAFATGAVTAATKEKPLEIPTDRELGFFLGARADSLAPLKRVGILPARLPVGFEARDEVKAALQTLVAEQLKKAGMEPVLPETFNKAFDRMNREVGGIYDPKLGSPKAEQYNAVYDHARREFVENDSLDGYVIIRILASRARFFSPHATWDGVRDRSSGRLAANALSELLLTDNTHSGTLPAYSVAVQIANPQDQIVFGRLGGLQLAAYYDMQKSKGVNGFMRVSAEDLFRDDARLQRAVSVATLPLTHTPEQIARGSKDPSINALEIDLDDLPPLPAGADQKSQTVFSEPREQILSSVRRVAIGPMGVGNFTMDEETQGRYLELIRAEISKLGWEIVIAPNARAAFAEQLNASENLFDAYTGKRDESRMSAARKSVFGALGVEPPDAILWPSLLRTSAPHDSGNAEWDGVSQNAVDLGPVRRGFWSGSGDVRAGEGAIPAVSLRIQLSNANDTTLYEAMGGIQVLEQFKGATREPLAPQELFRDQTREAGAVHAALRSLVMTPAEIEAELNPKGTKKKR